MGPETLHGEDRIGQRRTVPERFADEAQRAHVDGRPSTLVRGESASPVLRRDEQLEESELGEPRTDARRTIEACICKKAHLPELFAEAHVAGREEHRKVGRRGRSGHGLARPEATWNGPDAPRKTMGALFAHAS